jgi:hypothetical protein
VMEWMLWMTIAVTYIVYLFTVCAATFRKGQTALGILGNPPAFSVIDQGDPPAKGVPHTLMRSAPGRVCDARGSLAE